MDSARFVVTLAIAIVGGCAQVLPPGLPASAPALLVPPGEAPRLRVAGRGVPVYECRRGNGEAPAWALVAPHAELFDAQGESFGSHGAGPSWQARDGSRIVGTVVARVDAPGRGSIPWLLLRAQSDAGDGELARVSSVQRIRTEGGAAPARGCNARSLGRRTRIPYLADYVFFEPVDRAALAPADRP